MNKKLISIIVPIYNVAPYLERCIRSAMDNTYQNIEIICVNDGSTDRCLDILEKLAGEDSCITVISQHNQGLSAARNAGMEIASGEARIGRNASDPAAFLSDNPLPKMHISMF